MPLASAPRAGGAPSERVVADGVTRFVVGVDLGTGGLRAVASTLDGRVLASSARPIATHGEDGCREQRVDDWVRALEAVLDEIFARVSGTLEAISAAGTSGTIVHGPTAVLYSDTRAAAEVAPSAEAVGRSMNVTCGLPKMAWLSRQHGPVRFTHAVDVLLGWLLGAPCPTDATSALKSGWDGGWPATLFTHLPLQPSQLPDVVGTATPLGILREDLRVRWRRDGAPRVVAGATDANAAFYASGAIGAGDWTSALGSTLAVRGVSPVTICDPRGRFYMHRHPDSGWVVSGASSAGLAGMPSLDPARVDPSRLPTGFWYPLSGTVERLPLPSARASALWCGQEAGDSGRAFGLALVERWIFALAASLGAPPPRAVFTTGGGARIDALCQVRANVLDVPVHRPLHPDAAFGAAIIAAAGASGRAVAACAADMVARERTFFPSSLDGPSVAVALDAFEAAVRAAWER